MLKRCMTYLLKNVPNNINMSEKNTLLLNIKKNKKYKYIDDSLVKQEITKYLNANPNLIKFLDKEKSEKFKNIVKAVRAKLHLIHSSFKTSKTNIDQYLTKLRTAKNKEYLEMHDKILETSISAKERLKHYKGLYKKIFAITKKPKTIIDLGCGLNPISYPYMNIKNLNYYAFDINTKDIGFLNNYFKIMKNKGLNGKAKILNLKNTNISKLPKADICLMLKLLDPLEAKGHKLSETLITKLNTKHIVVSFATKTVTGRQMNYPYRGWIERMLNRINLKFNKITIENEVFYVIKK